MSITSLKDVKGIGPKYLQQFRAHHIWSTYDLVLTFPKKHASFYIQSLDVSDHQDVITIEATIVSEISISRFSRGTVAYFKVQSCGQILHVSFFQKPYLKEQFKYMDQVILTGTYHYYQKKINGKSIVAKEKHQLLKPIYNLKFISDAIYSNIVKHVLTNQLVEIYETIPNEFLVKRNLLSRKKAIEAIHLPEHELVLKQAMQRFKYEEAYQLFKKLKQSYQVRKPRNAIAYDIQSVKRKIETLPFTLTLDQQKAVNDIYQDLKSTKQSFRLVQGDVGSGKTIVALLAIFGVYTAKQQSLMLAPTEILARQHFEEIKKTFPNMSVRLVTSSTKDQKVLSEIKNHDVDVVVCTHAIFSEDIIFNDLALIIIDEQHKFGVEQRKKVIDKGAAAHVIYLTATPIPRTLAITYLGDIDFSIIKSKPKERKPVISKYLSKQHIEEAFLKIEEELKQGHKAFVVVPAINAKSMEDNMLETYQLLKQRFQQHIYQVHGKQKYEEQTEVLNDFLKDASGILLATSMVEVGIDIKEATVMVILSAERFGLSQLHQLRGRIGRNHLQSHCFFISKKEDLERLEMIEAIQDGFELSRFDLKQRGPGLFFEKIQSGFTQFRFLDFNKDLEILMQAKEDSI